jgi:hypothetical protein
MAKLIGNYKSLWDKQFHPIETSVYFLCGFSFDRFIFDQKTISFENLTDALKNGHLVSSYSFRSNIEEKFYKENGLKFKCYYMILNTICLENNQIIQLRKYSKSPDWKGDWSKNSSKWTPKLIEKLNTKGFSLKEETSFWMSYTDLIKYFYGAIVFFPCVNEPNFFKFNGVFLYLNSTNINVFNINLSVKTNINFSLFSKYDIEDIHFAPIFLIFEYQKNIISMKYITKTALIKNNNYFSLCLDPGNYKVIALSCKFWKFNEPSIPDSNNDFKLSFYAPVSIQCEMKLYSKDILTYALIQVCLKNGEKKQLQNNLFIYQQNCYCI